MKRLLMKRLSVTMLLCFLAAGVAVADPAPKGQAGDQRQALSVRTFQFKFKDAERAAAAIKSLVSSVGTMSIRPSTNALVVTDRPENLKAIAATLAEFDAPARAVKLSIKLVSAATQENPPPPAPELREIAGKLAMLRYNAIESLGSANIEGHEGEPASADLGDGYRAEFRFGEYDPASESIKLSDFRLSRIQKDQLISLFKAGLNLRIDQTVMFGATKTQGQRAVFLVFVAHR